MMKLTDLNIDCLENILEYLKFGDLLNAASSNKRLNKAAHYILIRKSWRKSVEFKSIRLSQKRLFNTYYGLIQISDLKTSLQYIRCFGHLISTIDFEMSKQKQSELDQRVMNYINEYCSDSSTEIKILNGLKGWEHLKKPFSNVEEVELHECQITDKDSLNRLFPKMQKLYAKYDGHEKSFFINANHFPNLEELEIKNASYYFWSLVCGENIAPILRLNPQLKYVTIHTGQPLFDSINFLNALESLQNLQWLILNIKTLSTTSIDSVIHLKSLKYLGICMEYSLELTEIPFLSGKLDDLCIKFAGKLNSVLFSFIDKHSSIEDLSLECKSLSVNDLSTIAKSLPLLTSISFCGCKISANDAINFMFKFQNLERFFFKINETIAYDDSSKYLRNELGNEWEFEIYVHGQTRIRRRSTVGPVAKKRKEC